MIVPDNSRQHGIALIMVMVTIFVLAMLAGGLALSMKVETKLARNASYDSELDWIGRSGVELACYILAEQLKISAEPYDSLNQIWAGGSGTMATSNTPLAGISLSNHKLGNGTYSIKITDLERKFNINSDALNGSPILEQAMIQMGVDAGEYPEAVASIQNWVDGKHRMGGADGDYYQGLTPPYQAKNGPIDDMSELLLIKGVTPEIYYGTSSTNYTMAAFQQKQHPFDPNALPSYPFGLKDVFTPISNGKININTASATVLQLIFHGDMEAVQCVIKQRAGLDGVDGTEDDVPFRQNDAGQECGPMVAQVIKNICTTRSSTFEVEVDAEINGYKKQYFAIVERTDPKNVQVLSLYWKTP